MSGGESSDRLETAIREVNARITEEVLNLRARLVALEQQLESLGREEVEEPPRRKRRAAGRVKGAAGLKSGARKKGERRERRRSVRRRLPRSGGSADRGRRKRSTTRKPKARNRSKTRKADHRAPAGGGSRVVARARLSQRERRRERPRWTRRRTRAKVPTGGCTIAPKSRIFAAWPPSSLSTRMSVFLDPPVEGSRRLSEHLGRRSAVCSANWGSCGVEVAVHAREVGVVLGERSLELVAVADAIEDHRVPLEDDRHAALEQRRGALEDVALVCLGVHPQHARALGVDHAAVDEMVEGRRLHRAGSSEFGDLALQLAAVGCDPVLSAAVAGDDELRWPTSFEAATANAVTRSSSSLRIELSRRDPEVLGLGLDRHGAPKPCVSTAGIVVVPMFAPTSMKARSRPPSDRAAP